MMDQHGIRFRAFLPFNCIHEVSLYASKSTPTGPCRLVAELTEHEMDNTASDPEPPITLKQDEAQSLMDALYNTGVRPSEGQGSAGMLRAVQDHLADVQKDKEWMKGRIA